MKKVFNKVMFVVGIIITLAFVLGLSAEAIWYHDEEILTASLYGMFGWIMVYCLSNVWQRIRD